MVFDAPVVHPFSKRHQQIDRRPASPQTNSPLASRIGKSLNYHHDVLYSQYFPMFISRI